MKLELVTAPVPGSKQAEFEEIMKLIGWTLGALAISRCGTFYVNRDVELHWQKFLSNKGVQK